MAVKVELQIWPCWSGYIYLPWYFISTGPSLSPHSLFIEFGMKSFLIIKVTPQHTDTVVSYIHERHKIHNKRRKDFHTSIICSKKDLIGCHVALVKCNKLLSALTSGSFPTTSERRVCNVAISVPGGPCSMRTTSGLQHYLTCITSWRECRWMIWRKYYAPVNSDGMTMSNVMMTGWGKHRNSILGTFSVSSSE